MQRSKRRRQIGTFRARGFPARSVGRSFAIEARYVALQGTVTGVLLALLATVASALSATRIRPAVALRMTD